MDARLEAFMAHVPIEELDGGVLSRPLEALLESVRIRWPGFPRADAAFCAYLGERFSDEGDLTKAIENRHAEDLYLAFHCLRGHAQAIQSLDAVLNEGVAVAVRRMDASDAFVEEVQQQVRVKLLVPERGGSPRLSKYRGSG